MQLRSDLPGGRRELRCRVGPFAVTVTEVPGHALSDREWESIQLARRSYAAMWGGGRVVADWADDPFDGREASTSALWDVRHYMAWIGDVETGDPPRLVTSRKVAPSLEGQAGASVDAGRLLDVRFWRVGSPAGYMSLWEPLRAFLHRLAPADELAERRVAAMGRVAAFPFGMPQTPRQRERTAIAWAAIQVLAADHDGSLLHLRTVRPDFQDRVLAVRGVDGSLVRPAFARTEELLGLPDGSIGLDSDMPVVRAYKLSMPGYFVDERDAARLLLDLLDEGELTKDDLLPAIGRVIEEGSAIGLDGRQLEELLALNAVVPHDRLAALLARPRAMKHLIPLLTGREPLSRMPLTEFRRRFLHETGHAPISASGPPAAWSAGARTLLDAVEARWQTGRGRRRPSERRLTPAASDDRSHRPSPASGTHRPAR